MTDGDGHPSDLRMVHTDHIVLTPIYSMFLRIYADTIDAGHSRPTMPWHPRNPCVYAMLGDKPVGGMVYSIEHHVCYVILAFVDDAHRGMGIAGRLQEEVEARAKDAGCHEMTAMVHISNQPSCTAFYKAGFTPTYTWHWMEKKIRHD